MSVSLVLKMGAANCENEDLEFKLIFGEEEKDPPTMGVPLEGEVGDHYLGNALLARGGRDAEVQGGKNGREKVVKRCVYSVFDSTEELHPPNFFF